MQRRIQQTGGPCCRYIRHGLFERISSELKKISNTPRVSKNLFICFILGIAILGIFLRFYKVNEQIIGDDEWHAINVASSTSFQYILTHYHSADHCIPLTLYYKILLKTIGLNELGLHSLQLILGFTMLILFPFIVKSVFKEKTSIIFSVFIAISPFLIYYSRYARPYIFIAFFSFISIFSFYFWISKKKLIYALIYIAGAVLTPYFNPLSFPTLLAPMICAFLYRIMPKSLVKSSIQITLPKIKELLLMATLILLGIAAWLIPALSSLGAISKKVGEGAFRFEIMMRLLNLFGGSGNDVIVFSLFLLFIYGLSVIYKKDRFLSFLFLLIFIFQILSIIIIKPSRLQIPVVLARYSISCILIYLLTISLGLNELIEKVCFFINQKISKIKITPVHFFMLFFLILLLSGPIMNIYGSQNNFTNHDDFEYGYKHRWFKVKKESLNLLSDFYVSLKNVQKKITIIETPYVLWWSGNFYHLYQKIHKKRVMIGHPKSTYVFPFPIMEKNIQLKNFVNIQDWRSVVKTGAEYLVIHKNIAKECLYVNHIFKHGTIPNDRIPNESEHVFERRYGVLSRKYANSFINAYRNFLGVPYYEDEWITVFSIGSNRTK